MAYEQATLNDLRALESFSLQESERQTQLLARGATTAQAPHGLQDMGKPFRLAEYLREHDITKVLWIGSLMFYTSDVFTLED